MTALPSLRGHRDAAGIPWRRFCGRRDVSERGSLHRQSAAAYCGQSKLGAGDRFRWTVTRSKDELDKLLAKYRLGPVKSIEVLERGVSGRARAVRVSGATRSEVIHGELRIRQTFGNLRSSLFVVEMQAGRRVFPGRRIRPRRGHVPDRRHGHGRNRQELPRDPAPLLSRNGPAQTLVVSRTKLLRAQRKRRPQRTRKEKAVQTHDLEDNWFWRTSSALHSPWKILRQSMENYLENPPALPRRKPPASPGSRSWFRPTRRPRTFRT
jgi:hypothetical protein